ncbi:unnamed protein product [Nezara viridula]|uniref:Uncharacterized protein n=1 Tax=Nezara viridula TaxID=85310 RepID=A0A9P0HNK6_NEZVI|nr:unnamed protein product [Nezara viridula]
MHHGELCNTYRTRSGVETLNGYICNSSETEVDSRSWPIGRRVLTSSPRPLCRQLPGTGGTSSLIELQLKRVRDRQLVQLGGRTELLQAQEIHSNQTII